jgi:hypothetical protein
MEYLFEHGLWKVESQFCDGKEKAVVFCNTQIKLTENQTLKKMKRLVTSHTNPEFKKYLDVQKINPWLPARRIDVDFDLIDKTFIIRYHHSESVVIPKVNIMKNVDRYTLTNRRYRSYYWY